MAHNKRFFAQMFRRYKINQSGNGFHVSINFEPLGEALDRAQMALDTQVWVDMQKYMPRRDGYLIGQTNLINQAIAGTGQVYMYDPAVEYAHYQYEGEKYVDPVYRVGGFYSPEWGWWSRPNVAKVPSGEPLFYQNPNAEAHWDEVAIARHGRQWLALVKRALRWS